MPRTQQDRSKATKTALINAARPMFAERGYAGVSADEIVSAAGLTRGALHHHFKDKQGLFRAVFELIEAELSAEIAIAMDKAADVPTRMAISLQTFLDACARPDVLRIALQDAPTVLGWETWREIESEHGLKLINELITQAASKGLLAHEPSEVLARFVFSLLVEAAMVIAHADDPAQARGQVEVNLGIMMAGLFTAPG